MDNKDGWPNYSIEDCRNLLELCPEGIGRIFSIVNAGKLKEQQMPVEFEPKITTDVSRADGVSQVWIFHLPGGDTEVGGKCAVVARAIAMDLYVKRLSRFGHLCDPADVNAVSAPAAGPAFVPLQSLLSEKRKQRDIVLDALKNGAITTADLSRDTGISAGTIAAILCNQLENKGLAHRTGRTGLIYRWAPGPQPAASAMLPGSQSEVEREHASIHPEPPALEPLVSILHERIKAQQSEPQPPPQVPASAVEPAYSHTTMVNLGNGGSIEMRLTCNVFTLNETDRTFLFDMVDRFATYRESGK